MSRTSPVKFLAVLVGAVVAVGLGVSLWGDRSGSGSPPVPAALSVGSASGSASASASGVAPPSKAREIELELSDEGLEEQLASIDAALGSSGQPVDSLALRGHPSELGDVGLIKLIERHPDLAPSKLSLIRMGLTSRGLAALLGSRMVWRLEVLDLRDNLLGVDGVKVLAESTRLGGLVELNLARNHLHEGGAVALAQARGLQNLKRLELAHNFIGPRGARALVEWSARPKLEDLGLAYNFLKDEGAVELSRGQWPGMTNLDLRSNEIDKAGARALFQSKALEGVALWLGSNFFGEQADAGAPRNARFDDAPANDRLLNLGRSGEEGFDLSRKGNLTVSAQAPAGLPSIVEFRELWIWEFGFVADFPTFMTPDRAPGNGKSRSFTWLDRATLSIGGYWPLEPTLDGVIAEELKAASAGRPSVERQSSKVAILRGSAGGKTTVQRYQLAHGALLYVSFSYDDELAAYFAPIVQRVMGSTSFDRKHLEEGRKP